MRAKLARAMRKRSPKSVLRALGRIAEGTVEDIRLAMGVSRLSASIDRYGAIVRR